MAEKDQFKGKTTLREMAENWAEVYGEDLANDYGGFYDELYEKYDNKPIPLDEIQESWRSAYGEEIDENYTGFWGSIGGKIPLFDLEDGLFETPDGDVVEMPDEEAHTIMDAAGKNKLSVSDYMANKNPQPAMKPEAKPAVKPATMKPEVKVGTQPAKKGLK